MRALILSCHTGEGHDSCAKAIKEVFDIHGDVCRIEDALRFVSEQVSQAVSKGHVFIYRRLPWLFNQGYRFTETHTDMFRERTAMYTFFAKGARELSEHILSGAYDTVICTHPFASLMLTEVQKRYSLPIKTAFVATDYTCSPSVKDSALEYYFIPDASLADDFACENIPKEKIFPCGIPIRQMFYTHMDKETAKQHRGIPTDRKHVVMVCGSMGCGPIEKLTDLLSDTSRDDVELTVVCGTNSKRKAQLEAKYGDRPHLHIVGYVKDMSALLDSADLYLTKAGGISVTEAATKKLPMVFIHAVAGCEDYNSDFYTQLGCAKRSDDAAKLVQLCLSLITEDDEYHAMISAFDRRHVQNSGECLYQTLKDA